MCHCTVMCKVMYGYLMHRMVCGMLPDNFKQYYLAGSLEDSLMFSCIHRNGL